MVLKSKIQIHTFFRMIWVTQLQNHFVPVKILVYGHCDKLLELCNLGLFLGRPLGETLWLHAPCVRQSVSQCVCQSIKLLVYAVCVKSFFFKRNWVHMWCVYTLQQGEHNVDGFVEVKGHEGGPVE